VGRNALREALRSLEIAGIVELRKGVKGGAFIRSGDSERMNLVMQDMFSLGSISLEELAETRLHVQELVMRLACERATEADFAALQANIDRTEVLTAEGRFPERVEMSRQFYRLLASATRNAVVAMIVHSVTEILMQFVDARVAAGGKPQPNLVARRREILRALQARDATSACTLMRTHLGMTHRMLKDATKAAEKAGAAPAPRARR
jgi:GntR family transcriptional repressor for pyruvate dehydrogenase complex